MSTENKVIYKGTVFTIKNIVPDMPNNEKTLLIQSLSDDLKRALQRMSA